MSPIIHIMTSYEPLELAFSWWETSRRNFKEVAVTFIVIPCHHCFGVCCRCLTGKDIGEMCTEDSSKPSDSWLLNAAKQRKMKLGTGRHRNLHRVASTGQLCSKNSGLLFFLHQFQSVKQIHLGTIFKFLKI